MALLLGLKFHNQQIWVISRVVRSIHTHPLQDSNNEPKLCHCMATGLNPLNDAHAWLVGYACMGVCANVRIMRKQPVRPEDVPRPCPKAQKQQRQGSKLTFELPASSLRHQGAARARRNRHRRQAALTLNNDYRIGSKPCLCMMCLLRMRAHRRASFHMRPVPADARHSGIDPIDGRASCNSFGRPVSLQSSRTLGVERKDCGKDAARMPIERMTRNDATCTAARPIDLINTPTAVW